MTTDAYGLQTSSTDKAATAFFEEAIYGLAAHRPSTGGAIGQTLAVDPDHVFAFTLKGFANMILGREELIDNAFGALADARRALLVKDGGTTDERILVQALEHTTNGHFARAADYLDASFADRPTTFLPFKISHSLRFMLGDAKGMLRASDRMLSTWSEDQPASGFLLGCHAFALEEHGYYDEAEKYGRLATLLQPEDSWGSHAVSHVYEMRGDTRAGIDWLEDSRSVWSRCNNFSFHMAWHLALLHMERGDHSRVLDLYDREIRPQPTDDFRDVANAVSLLWRLEHLGIHVGGRWSDLAEIVRRRRTDTTLVFASLHNLIALVALGDRSAAAELVMAMQVKAQGNDDQARVAAEVGLPLARAITGMGSEQGALDRIALQTPRVGGSNAQRDLFILALAESASRRGDTQAFGRICQARRRLKAEDNLITTVDSRASSPNAPLRAYRF